MTRLPEAETMQPIDDKADGNRWPVWVWALLGAILVMGAAI